MALTRKQRLEMRRRWQRDNREKHNAHNRVYFAVRRGDLVRPDRCERCGILCKPEGSHDDYTKPLDVEWLCRLCHARKDAGPRKHADECRRGHPFVEANTYVAPNGHRQCRTCNRAAMQRHRLTRRNQTS